MSTRNFEVPKNKGIQFEFGLDDTNIELKWLTRKIGTTKDVFERLMYGRERWDWYYLKQPTVIRRDSKGYNLKQEYEFPGLQDPLPADWHRIEVPGFQAIDWSYAYERKRTAILACNGLLIPEGGLHFAPQFNPEKSKSKWDYGTHLYFQTPTVSVFDPDGRLPLNLARNEIQGQTGNLESILVDDVCRNFITFCLIKGPQNHNLIENQSQLYLQPEYPGIKMRWPVNIFFSTPEGFGLTDPWNLSQLTSKTGLLIRSDNYGYQLSEESLEITMANYGFIITTRSSGTLRDFDDWHRHVVLSPTKHGESLDILKNLNIEGMRILMPFAQYIRFLEKQPNFVANSFKIELQTTEYVIMTWGSCRNTEILVNVAKAFFIVDASTESLTEIYLSDDNKNIKPGRVAQIWKDAVCNPIIPFDPKKRQSIIDALDERYARHIVQWQHFAH